MYDDSLDLLSSHPAPARLDPRAPEALRELIARACSGRRVLELGCGPGSIGPTLARLGVPVVCLDPDPELLAAAAAAAQRGGGAHRMTFVCAETHALPFADQSFELVLGSGLTEARQVNLALRELSRVLADPGAALLLEPVGADPLLGVHRAMPRALREGGAVDQHFGRVRTRHYRLDALWAALLHASPGFESLLRACAAGTEVPFGPASVAALELAEPLAGRRMPPIRPEALRKAA